MVLRALAMVMAMGARVDGLKFNPFSMSKNKLLGKLWEPVRGTSPGPPRSGACAAVDESGRTWLFGGYAEEADGSRAVVNDLWVYNGLDTEGSGGWSLAQPPSDDFKPGLLIDYSTRPRARLVSAAAVVEHELLVIGGTWGTESTPPPTISPPHTTTPTAPHPHPPQGWDPGLEGDGGEILEDVWALDLETQEWSKCESPLPRGSVDSYGGTIAEPMPHASHHHHPIPTQSTYRTTHGRRSQTLVSPRRVQRERCGGVPHVPMRGLGVGVGPKGASVQGAAHDGGSADVPGTACGCGEYEGGSASGWSAGWFGRRVGR